MTTPVTVDYNPAGDEWVITLPGQEPEVFATWAEFRRRLELVALAGGRLAWMDEAVVEDDIYLQAAKAVNPMGYAPPAARGT